MKKILVLLVILAFALVACEKQAEQNTITNTGGGNQQGSAPAAPQQTTTTTVTQPPEETNQNTGQEILNKIDWNSIDDKTIVLVVDEFGSMEYVGGTNEGGRLFVPNKEDFLEFINNYDFELTTREENGKTVYILTEIKKKLNPIADGLSLLPPEVQDAFENLLVNYPSGFSSSSGTSSGGGTGGE